MRYQAGRLLVAATRLGEVDAMDTIRLHLCGPACAPGCAEPQAAIAAVARREAGWPVIDMHCHVMVPAVEALVAGHPQKLAEDRRMQMLSGEASVRHNREQMIPAALPRLLEPQTRLADMATMGIDQQLLSPAPAQYYYWADEALAEHLVELQNQAIAGLCEQYPQQFLGLGAIALQHPSLALRQLERAVQELGLKGIEISTHVGARELDDPAFEPFWARAEALQALVFIHPFGCDFGQRMVPYYLSNLAGQPLETTMALSHLIFSGLLDRYPRLKILAAHGGGYLPQYCGRSDQGYRVRPEASGMAKAPSQYLHNIWFDSLVFSPLALRHLIDQVGAGQVVVGTDYPFDMGSFDLHRLLDQVPRLTPEERRQILSGNARRLLDSVEHQAGGGLVAADNPQ